MGQEVIITVESAAKRRSNKLNKYWWAVVVPMVRERLLKHATMSEDCRAEMDDEMTHQIIKLATGVSHIVKLQPRGGAFIIEGRSRDKTNKEFLDFILKTQQWASESLGLYIPDPNETPEEAYADNLAREDNEV